MVDAQIEKLIGVFIVVLVAVALLPEIFTAIAGMSGVGSSIPTWLVSVLTALISVGMVYLIWNLVGTGKKK